MEYKIVLQLACYVCRHGVEERRSLKQERKPAMPINPDSSHDSVEQLRRQAAAEPHDLDLRFRYGAALFWSGEIRSALPELQKARQHPGHRAEAMRMLGEIFDQLGMSDVATYLQRGAEDDDADPDAGSAPKPAPLHPITPLVASAANEWPREPDDDPPE
jgi:hypothetical protein